MLTKGGSPTGQKPRGLGFRSPLHDHAQAARNLDKTLKSFSLIGPQSLSEVDMDVRTRREPRLMGTLLAPDWSTLAASLETAL